MLFVTITPDRRNFWRDSCIAVLTVSDKNILGKKRSICVVLLYNVCFHFALFQKASYRPYVQSELLTLHDFNAVVYILLGIDINHKALICCGYVFLLVLS